MSPKPTGWTEQDVEDWICEMPRYAWDDEDVQVVGRQITLPSGGRLDVLMMCKDDDGAWRVIVVEVKRDVVNVSAIDQVLSYMYEMERLWRQGTRVCGVLLGMDFDPAVVKISRAIPGLYLAQYWTTFDGCAGWSKMADGWFELESGRPSIAEHRLAPSGGAWESDQSFLDSFSLLAKDAARRVRESRDRRLPARLTECPPPPERRLKVV